MLIKVFTVPIIGGDEINNDMIAFMKSHKIVNVEKKFVRLNDVIYWCFCLTYMDTTSSSASSGTKEKIDYQKVLDPKAYARFEHYRQIRKQVAEADGVSAYVVFTDAELAEIAKMEHVTEDSLRALKGIGKGKVDKYGKYFCEEYVDTNSANGAASQSRVRERTEQ